VVRIAGSAGDELIAVPTSCAAACTKMAELAQRIDDQLAQMIDVLKLREFAGLINNCGRVDSPRPGSSCEWRPTMETTSTILSCVLATLAAGACAAHKESVMLSKTTPTTTAVTESAATKLFVTNKVHIPEKSGHVAVNGVNYYYEIHGEGEPLLLLHGGLGSIDMFAPVLPALTRTHQVIGIDLHGHGRTALGDRKISAIDMGDDLAVVLDNLGYKQVDTLGYSLGGIVGFRLAVQHPEKVRRLVLVSAPFAQDGFYPEMLPLQAQTLTAAMADMMKDTPMYKSYAAIAPNPAEFPKLLDSVGELMSTPYNWADDVKTLKMPVMLVYGDGDMYRPEHIVDFYKLLGGGLKDAGWMREHLSQNRLAILPDVTHYDMLTTPALATTVLPFLDGKRGAENGSEQVAKQ
jgi:pimeloyl-ACP methyl ester carboxylesterase